MTEGDEMYYPLYAQKEAGHMVCDVKHRNDRVLFVLITPFFAPAQCVWHDPHLGFFQVVGKEDKGVMRIGDLPKGTLIINQRYESTDKEN
jgi:hypothetical protein